MNTKNMILSGLFAAILCIFSLITIPIGTVPVTLSVFALALVSAVLPIKCAFFSICVYILAGLTGLPVFAGFGGGPGVLFGPTGGYIWSYLLFPLIVGCGKKEGRASAGKVFLKSFVALIVLYVFGTLQFSVVQSVSFVQALVVCVLPFIAFDIIKIFLASVVSVRMKKIPL